MTSNDHLFDQLKRAGRSIMEGQPASGQENGRTEQEETKSAGGEYAVAPAQEDQLALLIREAGDRIMANKERKLEELGMKDLTVDLFRYVAVIDTLERPNASAIANSLGLTRPSVTAILNKLEGKGLLEKRRDRKDGRSVRIALTDSGMAVAQAWRMAHREFSQLFEERLDPGEYEKLVGLMTKGMNRGPGISK